MQSIRKYQVFGKAILGAFLLIFFMIVFWRETRVHEHKKHALEEQARVLENELWNFDKEGALVYLELSARLYNYESLAVFLENGQLFARVEGPRPGILSRLLLATGLIGLETVGVEVFHDGVAIGRIEAVRRHDTIFLYLYLLLVLGLMVILGKSYLSNLEANVTLESAVKERTRELQEANSRLVDEERRYREIYNAPNEGILIHEVETGKVIDVNEGMLQMYGYPYSEAIKQDHSSLSAGFEPYSGKDAKRLVQQAIEKGSHTFRWRARRRDGSLFWAEVSLKYMVLEDRDSILAIVRDISLRQKTENELEAEKERLSVTLRSIGDGVITTDVDGRVELVNKVAEALTGWTQEEARNLPLDSIFNKVSEKNRKRSESPVTEVLASGTVTGLTSNSLLISRDGREKYIADTAAPIRDRDSQIIGVVLVFRDVTEQSRLEKEILKGRKLESVGLLAGGIAHDFNNILTAVLGNINLVLSTLSSDDKEYRFLMEAEKASLRAKGLTRQLLTFAKGGEPVKKLADVVEIIKDSSSFVLRGSKVRCDYNFAENLWPAEIDADQISQVIQNLIINAKQAMPEGGFIEISAENEMVHAAQIGLLAEGAYIKLTVRDSGTGIPDEMLEVVFDPYFTTKEKGSGLGLAITHSIVANHSGHIEASSSKDQGTTITLYLPATMDGVVVSQKAEAEDALAGTAARVLIMDDDQMICTVASEMLSMKGFEATVTNGGEQAIRVFAEALANGSPFDLVIMDLTIPGGMGGQEAVKGILKLQPDAKVIVASGYSNDPILANYKDYGFCAAIIKPFHFTDFQKTLAEVLA